MLDFFVRPIDRLLRRYAPRFYARLEARDRRQQIVEQQIQDAVEGRFDPNMIPRPHTDAGQDYARRLCQRKAPYTVTPYHPKNSAPTRKESQEQITKEMSNIAITCFKLGRAAFVRTSNRSGRR